MSYTNYNTTPYYTQPSSKHPSYGYPSYSQPKQQHQQQQYATQSYTHQPSSSLPYSSLPSNSLSPMSYPNSASSGNHILSSQPMRQTVSNSSSDYSSQSGYSYSTPDSAVSPSEGGFPDYPGGIEVQYTIAPSTKQGKAKARKTSTTTSSPIPHPHPHPKDEKPYICLEPHCTFRTAREYDLKRHMKNHFQPSEEEMFSCPGKNCTRVGKHGFKRKDHMNEHIANFHNGYVDGKLAVVIKKKERGGRK